MDRLEGRSEDQPGATEKIGQADLETFAQGHGSGGVSPTAFNRYIAALRLLGREANKRQGILLPELSRLKTRKVIEHAYPIITEEQARSLIFWPDEPDRPTSARHSAMYALNYSLGLLFSDMITLNCEDYQSGPEASLKVRSAAGLRTLPVLPAVATLIDRHLEDWPDRLPSQALFPTDGGERPGRSVRRYNWELNRRAASLGIRFKLGSRALREAFKAHMLAAGAPHQVLKELMGLSSLDVADLIGKRERGVLKADEREP